MISQEHENTFNSQDETAKLLLTAPEKITESGATEVNTQNNCLDVE